MHIVIFVDYHVSSIGGVASSVASQAEALEAAGHTVTIVCPPPPVKGMGSVLSTVILPAAPIIRPNGFPMVIPGRRVDERLEKALGKRPPVDIVHVQTNLGVGITGVRFARRHQLPLVQTMHGRDDVFAETTYRFPYLTTLIALRSHRRYVAHQPHTHLPGESRAAKNAWQVMVNHARAADHVVIPSRHFADKFRIHGLQTPISIISNGIRQPLLDTLQAIRPKKYIPHSPLRLVWIGRMSAEKRPLETIQAIEKIPGVLLDMYGDGPLMHAVCEYIARNNLEKKIDAKGRMTQDEIVRSLVTYDLLVYPSYRFDNQPMVLLEATVAGVPVVYCDPDLAECMPAGGAVLTSSPEVKDLRRTVRSLATDPARLRKMSAAMRDGSQASAQVNATRQMVRLYQKLARK